MRIRALFNPRPERRNPRRHISRRTARCGQLDTSTVSSAIVDPLSSHKKNVAADSRDACPSSFGSRSASLRARTSARVQRDARISLRRIYRNCLPRTRIPRGYRRRSFRGHHVRRFVESPGLGGIALAIYETPAHRELSAFSSTSTSSAFCVGDRARRALARVDGYEDDAWHGRDRSVSGLARPRRRQRRNPS